MCFIPTEIRTVCHLKYGGPTPPEMLQKSPNADSTMFCKFPIRELQPLAEINGSLLPLPLDERRQISSSVLGDSGKHHLEKYRAWQTHLRVAPPGWGCRGCTQLAWERDTHSLPQQKTQTCTALNPSPPSPLCSHWCYMINITSNLSLYNIPPIFLCVMFTLHQVTVLVIPPLFACPLEEASFLLLIKSLIFTKIIPTLRWLDYNLSLSHKWQVSPHCHAVMFLHIPVFG